MDTEALKHAAKLLQKYEGIHPADLMDDIKERIGALILKIADMDADEAEERAIMDTFLIWLKNTTEFLTKTQEGLIKILKEVKKK